MPERRGNLSPEARTVKLFEASVMELADELVTRDELIVIGIPNSNRRIRLVEVESFERVGARYREIKDMRPGDLWNPPVRRIAQSLIVARDKYGVGSCVRLLEAEYFDPTSNSFVPEITLEGQEFKQKEGDIARYLGLNKNDRSQLKFLDDSNTLYIIKKGQEIKSSIPPEDANRELSRLLK